MKNLLDEKIEAVLKCPHCKNKLESTSDGNYFCRYDNLIFDWTDSGSLDLRPKHPLSVDINISIPPKYELTRVSRNYYLPINAKSNVSFDDLPIPKHLTQELISYFPKAAGKESLMLDLGCGNTLHRQVCEKAGYTYVGMDKNNPKG